MSVAYKHAVRVLTAIPCSDREGRFFCNKCGRLVQTSEHSAIEGCPYLATPTQPAVPVPSGLETVEAADEELKREAAEKRMPGETARAPVPSGASEDWPEVVLFRDVCNPASTPPDILTDELASAAEQFPDEYLTHRYIPAPEQPGSQGEGGK